MKESDSRQNSIVDIMIAANAEADNVIETNTAARKSNISAENGLGRIYKNLHDIKSRLIFIVDMKKKFAAAKACGEDIDIDEYGQYREIERVFIHRYIENGNTDIRKIIFETLGEMKGDNAYASYLEYQTVLGNIDNKDDYREEKAQWIAKTSGSSLDYAVINEVIGTFTEALPDRVEADILVGQAEENYYNTRKFSDSKKVIIKTYADVHNDDYEDEIKDWIDDIKNDKSIKNNRYHAYLLRNDKINARYINGKKRNDVTEPVYQKKIENLFLGMKTMEERLRFIVDIDTKMCAENVVYGYSSINEDFIASIREFFIDKYVVNGNEEMVQKVFKEFASINSEYTINLVSERDKLKSEYNKKGMGAKILRSIMKGKAPELWQIPDNIDGKVVDVLMRSTVPGTNHYNSGAKGLFFRAVMDKFTCRDTKGRLNTTSAGIVERAGIDEDMSVREYACAIGITDEDAQEDYASEHDVDLDDKAYLMFQDVRGGKCTTEDIVRLEEDYLREYVNNILKKQSIKVQRTAGLNDKDIVKFQYINIIMAKEPDFTGIDDWYDGDGKEIIAQMDKKAGEQIINDFDKTYDKSVGYDQYIRLHTGYDIVAAKNAAVADNAAKKADCLAKAIAANELKKSGVGFSIKKIHKVAEGIKQRPEFCNVIDNADALDEALTDSSHVSEIADKLFAEPYKIDIGRLEEYINNMNIIYNNIMSKEGRSASYGAYYDAVKSISDLKGTYDFKLEGDREAAAARIAGLNMTLLNTAKNYINGKERVRTSDAGKERFNNAIDGLSVLREYVAGNGVKATIDNTVKTVNIKRNAPKTSSKYVNIESFGAKRAEKAKADRIKQKKKNNQTMKK